MSEAGTLPRQQADLEEHTPPKAEQGKPEATQDDTRQGWVEAISRAYSATISKYIETGHKLNKAKKQLGDKALWAMVENDLPFNKRHAGRMMRVAGHSVLSDTTHESSLPADLETVNVLAGIEDPTEAKKAIDAEEIHPRLSRQEARQLVQQKGGKATAPQQPKTGTQLRTHANQLCKALANASDQDLSKLRSALSSVDPATLQKLRKAVEQVQGTDTQEGQGTDTQEGQGIDTAQEDTADTCEAADAKGFT